MKTPITGVVAITLGVTGGAAKAQSAAAADSRRPNIVVMIADDCTYRDLQCYGSVNSTTPNIDRLAAEGMRFLNFFQATPMSSPTRQCLMTGLYPVRSGAYPNHAFVKEGTHSVVQYMRAAGYRTALQGKRHINPREVFDFEYLSAPRMDVDTAKIRPFIEDAGAKGEPFCLFVCSHQPHIPWNQGAPGAIDPDKLVLPSYLVDTPETRADFRRYLAEVNFLDKQVGAVCDLLREQGADQNTVFIFTSEQGNSMPFAKYTCYDMGLQTGMIVRWPGVVKAGSTCDALAEYVDVTPTLIQIAGAKPDKSLDGRSFLKLLTQEKREHKKEVYGIQTTRGTNNGSPFYAIRSVRDKRYVYIRNLTPEAEFRSATSDMNDPLWRSWVTAAATDQTARQLVYRYQHRPAEELYDRTSDPDQQRNLAGDKRYAKVKRALARKLDDWMRAQGDRGQQTEMEAFAHQTADRLKAQRRQLEAEKNAQNN